MPEIIENTQNQQYTKSEKGRNVTPLLVANSHFFLESGSFSQNETQKFGVVSENEFRTTAKISYTGKLYAICQAQIFIQPQTGNPNKVNLLLRPYKQPIKEVPIKYFIYRGLNKSDFFKEVNNETVLINEDGSNSEFVNHVWSEFNSFYSQLDESEKPADFKASTIGFFDDDTIATETLIDEYLYKISTFTDDVEDEATQFELPMIPRGTHLGNVDGKIGLDIVLDKGDYTNEHQSNPFPLDLAFARAQEGKIDTSSVTGIDNAALYQKRCIKEACVNFIDPAAFYGLHCNGVGNLFVGDKGAATLKTTKQDIYPSISSFITSTTQYVYIQSNRQRSYNFYGNYVYSLENANTLKWDTDPTVMANEVKFGTLGWPVHLFSNEETIYMQLTTDNYENAALYAHLGNITTANEQNFVRSTNLLQEISEDEQNPVDLNYTKPIGFKNEKEGTDSIATIIHLIYEGKELKAKDAEDTSIEYVLKEIDDVFGLIDAVALTKTKYNVTEFTSVVDEKPQLINFSNSLQENDIGLVKTKRIKDVININEEETLPRITYETLLTNIKTSNSSYLTSNSSSLDKSTTNTLSFSSSQNNFYQPLSPYYFSKEIFTDGSDTVTGLLLKVDSRHLPTKKILGITQKELDRLKALIPEDNFRNSKIYFNELDELDSINEVFFRTYELEVLGEDGLSKLLLVKPELKIKVYSIDGFMFFSKEYSDYAIIEEYILKLDYTL